MAKVLDYAPPARKPSRVLAALFWVAVILLLPFAVGGWVMQLGRRRH